VIVSSKQHQKAKQQQGQRIVSPQAAPSRSGQGSNEWAQGNAPLRWANTVQPKSDNEPKSLAEIQAEEEQKMKQVQTVSSIFTAGLIKKP
jgi:hypothetical protein